MKRLMRTCIILGLAGSVTLAAVGSKNAEYVGGTISAIKERAEGKMDTSSDSEIVFRAENNPELRIPYAAIRELEYGQKAGRRVAMAVLVSPWALFSKKRNHYLTLTYEDDAGREQAAVFELGKDIVRTTLKIIETRSGREIHYQDEDARKSGVGGR